MADPTVEVDLLLTKRWSLVHKTYAKEDAADVEHGSLGEKEQMGQIDEP